MAKVNGTASGSGKANGSKGGSMKNSTPTGNSRAAGGGTGKGTSLLSSTTRTAGGGEAGPSLGTPPSSYRPTESEPFMNERQRHYFRNKLLAWKEDIVRLNRETLQGLTEDSAQHADVADRATFETDRALELRARDRQRKLVSKIDAALARIEDGSYGYCEETGEPISLKRLDARPIATLSIEAQERHERRERVFRED
jgi:DnaK suppressor protein